MKDREKRTEEREEKRAQRQAERRAKSEMRKAKSEKRKEKRAPAPVDEKTAEKRAKRKKAWGIVLNILCALSGSFFVGVYIPYFIWHLSRGHKLDVAASLLVFAGVLLPLILRVPLRKLLKKLYTPLKIVWCFAMCFYMVTFSIFFVAVHTHDDVPQLQTDRQKVVVVFGCQVHESGALSAELSSRLKKAAAILEKYPEAICVVSGGQGSDEPYSEARAMKEYLVKRKNVDEGRILTEERSTSTAENIRFSIDRLKEEGYEIEDCAFICVSSTFHTPRTYYLCRKLGVPECSTVSAPTPYRFLDYLYTVREYMSYVYLLIFGY